MYVLVISALMPGIIGLELLMKIKKVNAYARTILMSEYEVNDKLFHQYLNEKIIDKFIIKAINLGRVVLRSKHPSSCIPIDN